MSTKVIQFFKGRTASDLWSSYLPAFMDYVFDLSPENLAKVRQHTALFNNMWPLTDLCKYNFYGKNEEQLRNLSFVRKYLELTSNIPEKFHFSEPFTDPISKHISAEVDGKLLSRDGLGFQNTITNLYNLGVFSNLESKSGLVKIIEIGAGYGSLAYQIGSKLENKVCYFIIDLPEILLWSGAFLTVNTPLDEIYFYDPSNYSAENLGDMIGKYRYILLPHYRIDDLKNCSPFNLVINIVSFQEMRTDQVRNYMEFSKQNLDGYIYSDNQPKSPRNEEIEDDVEKELGEYFSLFPQSGFYNKYGLNPLMRRIHLGYSKNINFEKFINREYLYGLGYNTDGKTIELTDDVFRKVGIE